MDIELRAIGTSRDIAHFIKPYRDPVNFKSGFRLGFMKLAVYFFFICCQTIICTECISVAFKNIPIVFASL